MKDLPKEKEILQFNYDRLSDINHANSTTDYVTTPKNIITTYDVPETTSSDMYEEITLDICGHSVQSFVSYKFTPEQSCVVGADPNSCQEGVAASIDIDKISIFIADVSYTLSKPIVDLIEDSVVYQLLKKH